MSGRRTSEWADSGNDAWTTFSSRLTAAGIAANQLRVIIWSDYASADLRTFEGEVEQNKTWIEAIVANIATVYTACQIVYLCPHHYVGYADIPANPDVFEPDNYWNVWSMQRVITGRSGTAAPWTVAGPYLWANGTTVRRDGREYICLDFEQTSGSAGVHASPSGGKKAAQDILNFLRTDHSARWYLRAG